MKSKSEKPNIFAQVLARKAEAAKKKRPLGSDLAKSFQAGEKPQAWIGYGGRNGNGKP